MTPVLTASELAAIRKRVEAATPAPWATADEFHSLRVAQVLGTGRVCATPIVRYRESRSGARRGETPRWYGYRQQEKDDAAFIAAARTDIPRLLATVEALQEERDRLREALEMVVGALDAGLDVPSKPQRNEPAPPSALSAYAESAHA